jgi:hypothetical protein
MPLFLVELRDGSIKQVLRAACMSCARRVAVEASGVEGTQVWRDPASSTVKLIEPNTGINGVVLRVEEKP